MFARTKRLTLRPGWPEDARALAAAIGHNSVVRNLARAPWPYDVADADAFLSLPRRHDEPRFVVCDHTDGYRLVGGVGITEECDAVGHCRYELGYWLAPDVWGRGYATEAASVVIEMARHALPLRALVARYYDDNPASGRVLRKLGFGETGRSTIYSLGRGVEAACVDLTLDLEADRDAAMPIAA